MNFSDDFFNLERSRLTRVADIADMRELARRRVPKGVFDYVDGAAGTEEALRRQKDYYLRAEFTPRLLVDISKIDTSTSILGVKSPMPFALAPTGFTRLMHHSGEVGVARGIKDSGLHYALSTLGTTSIEELAKAAPSTRKIFQLYLWKDRLFNIELLERAAREGYDSVALTLDTPIAGLRNRDVRNGFTIPPTLSLSSLIDISMHPRWWFNLLASPPIEFANLKSTSGSVADLVGQVFDPAITAKDIHWLREHWQGKIIAKGVTTTEDALTLVDLGVDAIWISNHGGRQLEMAPIPLEVLPKIRAGLPAEYEIYIDGGVTTGADIIAAIALGANAVFIGRAYLYGLMAGGQDGVARALEILSKEVRTQMGLMGVTSIDQLSEKNVKIRPREGR
ncbi:unnamed protein product [Acidithrix sp. C25]|nr:unnamed protein product [Acidithrix sp. C25]